MSYKKVFTHIVINLLVAVPIFLSLLFYLQLIGPNTKKSAAGLASIVFTFWFLVSLYAGRYLSRLITPSEAAVQGNGALIVLSVSAVSCFSVLALLGTFSYGSSTTSHLLLFAIPFLILGVCAGALIKIVRNKVAAQLRKAETSSEQSKRELQFLQSQLSPHFLFNTLNNLYGISIAQHEKVPSLLLKLADLLRYAVYDTRETLVQLNDEISYINNYIDFEKIRIGNRLLLTTAISDSIGAEVRIAPMVLIVFIENAFKHSRNTVAQKIYIDLTLKVSGDEIFFSIRNSQSYAGEQDDADQLSSGVGLINVRKQLDLLYAGEYKLQTDNQKDYYQVTLQLKVK